MIRLDQPNIKTIEHSAQQNKNCVSFAQGAVRIGGVDQAIKDNLRELLTTDCADYYSHSLGIPAIREKLAAYLNVQHGTTLTLNNIALTHGSTNGISTLSLILLNAGDEVLLPEPTYPAYFNILALAKANIKTVPAYTLSQTHAGPRWDFDIDLIKQSATARTKMIIIAHPSNPCGYCLSQAELNDLIAWCESKEIYLIVDEAYDNYFFEAPHTSSTAIAKESPYIIRTGTFSKTFGMSGWRMGFVVAHPTIISTMAAAHDGLIACPTVISQYALSAALDHIHLTQEYATYIRANRDRACTLLQPLATKGIVEFTQPPAGLFLLLKTQQQDTMALAHQILNEAQVALVPGKDFGPSGKPFLRLCYARTHDKLETGIKRIIDHWTAKR